MNALDQQAWDRQIQKFYAGVSTTYQPTDPPGYYRITVPGLDDHFLRDYQSATVTYTTTKELPMKDREKYLLVNRDTAAIVSRHEDEADAASEGARRAAKDGGVYLIFKAIKKVQPKPVDVESVDL